MLRHSLPSPLLSSSSSSPSSPSSPSSSSLRLALALLAVTAGACVCGPAGRPCINSGDCLAGESCVKDEDGNSTCQPAEAGEGEGDAGEGEGDAGEGEGEGEGDVPVCGDGVVTGDKACDDGNDNENDLCTSQCGPTSVVTTPLVGASADIGLLPFSHIRAVWASEARGAVVADADSGAIFFRPPGKTLFYGVDDDLAPHFHSVAATDDVDRPTAVAVAPDGHIVYFDDRHHVVKALDPVTGEVTHVAGSGQNTTGGSDPFFGFTDPVGTVDDLPLAATTAVDVDQDGTVYVAGGRRVVSVAAGATDVFDVAGTLESDFVAGTPAQQEHFDAVEDVSVEEDGAGAPVAVWIVATLGGDRSLFRVVLAGGSIETIDGTGFQCDGPIAGCAIDPQRVVADGAGGAFFAGPRGSNVEVGHVDAARVVQRRSASTASGGPADIAVIAPDQVLVAQVNASDLFLSTGASDGEFIEPPAPARGTDRSPPIGAAGASADEIFFASGSILYAVDEAGAVRVVVDRPALGGCDDAGAGDFFSGIAAAADASQGVFFTQSHDNRLCVVNAIGASAVGEPVASAAAAALRATDLVVASGNDLFVMQDPLNGGTPRQVEATLTSPAVALAAEGDVVQALLADGHRKLFAAPPAFTVTDAGQFPAGEVSGLAVAGSGASFVFSVVNHDVELVDNSFARSVIAGDGTPGFTDGPAASARFEELPHQLVKLADGALGLVSSGSIRLVKDGAVTTLVGSDHFDDYGAFASARVVKPKSLSCVGHRCVVFDEAMGVLKLLDFDTNRVERVLGREGVGLGTLVSAALVDADTVLFTDGEVIAKADLPDGAASTVASGFNVVAPSVVLPLGDGSTFLYVDGNELKQAGTTTKNFGAIGDTVVGLALDATNNVLFLGGAGTIRTCDLDTAVTGSCSDAVFGGAIGGLAAPLTAFTRDRFGNFFVASADGVFELFADGTTRTLVAVGDDALPFAGDIVHGFCSSGGLAMVDDDVIFADRCTGAITRVHIE